MKTRGKRAYLTTKDNENIYNNPIKAVSGDASEKRAGNKFQASIPGREKNSHDTGKFLSVGKNNQSNPGRRGGSISPSMGRETISK